MRPVLPTSVSAMLSSLNYQCHTTTAPPIAHCAMVPVACITLGSLAMTAMTASVTAHDSIRSTSSNGPGVVDGNGRRGLGNDNAGSNAGEAGVLPPAMKGDDGVDDPRNGDTGGDALAAAANAADNRETASAGAGGVIIGDAADAIEVAGEAGENVIAAPPPRMDGTIGVENTSGAGGAAAPGRVGVGGIGGMDDDNSDNNGMGDMGASELLNTYRPSTCMRTRVCYARGAVLLVKQRQE